MDTSKVSKQKSYYVPSLHDAGRLFKMTTERFIEETLGYAEKLANTTSLTAIQKAELRDMKPFLESVVRLQQTTEYASVDKAHRTKFASRAQELLQKIDGTVKAVTLSEILNLI